jgi:endogenous inhibitor of DNA gyrase (YacG/DUF329 family)
MAGLQKPSKVELCVFCRRHPVESVWRPFCSERCKPQDLARWADEAYRVASDPVADDDPSDPGDDVNHG